MELKATRAEVDGHVATVWLDRPQRHNAWTGRMHAEYRWLLPHLAADPAVRAIVVTGTPPAFCVGGDSEALAGHAERGAYDNGLAAQPEAGGPTAPPDLDADFAWQWALPVPVIAAVNGACAGVGFAVALFADLRFGAAAAKCTTAAPKLGLPAEYGSSWVLPRLVGATRAADLLLSGRVVTPAETESWGLWNGVAENGSAALVLAHEYAHLLATTVGPHALATTKAQLHADLRSHDVAAAIRESNRLLSIATGTAEYREGVAALREKRPPRFDADR